MFFEDGDEGFLLGVKPGWELDDLIEEARARLDPAPPGMYVTAVFAPSTAPSATRFDAVHASRPSRRQTVATIKQTAFFQIVPLVHSRLYFTLKDTNVRVQDLEPLRDGDDLALRCAPVAVTGTLLHRVRYRVLIPSLDVRHGDVRRGPRADPVDAPPAEGRAPGVSVQQPHPVTELPAVNTQLAAPLGM